MQTTGRGRGRRRGGRHGGGGGSRPGWFLHDDRDEPDTGAASGGYGEEEDVFEGADPAYYSSAGNDITVRISRKGGREVSDTTGGGQLLVEVNSGGSGKQRVVVVTGKEGWEYRDPGGQVQGPFRATQMIKWLNMQYFDGSLHVRKVSQHGSGHWGRLDAVLKDIQREAALAGAADGGGGGGAPPRTGSGKGRGGGSAGPHVLAVPVTSPRGASGRAAAAAGPDVSGYVVSGQRQPRRQQGQPDSNLAYFNGIKLGGPEGPRARRGGEREDYGGRFGGGGGREDAGGRGGRGGRGGGRGGGRREGRGGRGGRGGSERGGGYGGAAAEAAAAERAAVQKLFTGEVALGTEQPMWRYIDPDGNMQARRAPWLHPVWDCAQLASLRGCTLLRLVGFGPFPAKDMLGWHEAGYLHDKSLPMCGTSRKVSPPNLPTPDYFVPLGVLIAYVRSGKKFVAVEPDDICSGKVPEYLQRLKGSTKPAAEKEAKAADGKAAPSKAAAGKAGRKAGAAAGKSGDSAAALAAQVAAAAVRNVLVALGEAPAEPEPEPAAAAGQAEDTGTLAASVTAAAFAAVLGPATPAVSSAAAAEAAAEPAAEAAAEHEEEEEEEEEEAPEHEEGDVIGEEEEDSEEDEEAEVAAEATELQKPAPVQPASAAGRPPPLEEEPAEPAATPAEAPAAAQATPAAAAAPPPLEDAAAAPADLPPLVAADTEAPPPLVAAAANAPPPLLEGAADAPPPLLEAAAGAAPPLLEPAGAEAAAAGGEAALGAAARPAAAAAEEEEEDEFEDAEDTMASPLPSPAS
ncbi:hypothetical protein ABPG75_010613 [Micractinium tetrahymenae]